MPNTTQDIQQAEERLYPELGTLLQHRFFVEPSPEFSSRIFAAIQVRHRSALRKKLILLDSLLMTAVAGIVFFIVIMGRQLAVSHMSQLVITFFSDFKSAVNY